MRKNGIQINTKEQTNINWTRLNGVWHKNFKTLYNLQLRFFTLFFFNCKKHQLSARLYYLVIFLSKKYIAKHYQLVFVQIRDG